MSFAITFCLLFKRDSISLNHNNNLSSPKSLNSVTSLSSTLNQRLSFLSRFPLHVLHVFNCMNFSTHVLNESLVVPDPNHLLSMFTIPSYSPEASDDSSEVSISTSVSFVYSSTLFASGTSSLPYSKIFSTRFGNWEYGLSRLNL